MLKDKKCQLLANASPSDKAYQSITPDDAGWKYLNFEARTMKSGDEWSGFTGNYEYLFVLLGGNFKAVTSEGKWETKNGRKDVFKGLPHALYLSKNSEFSISPSGEHLDIACGW